MTTTNILVFDSGQGGLPYLKPIVQQLSPLDRAITIDYLADNLFFPYGSKATQTLQDRFSSLAFHTSHLQTKKYHLLIIACNTASIYGQHIFKQHWGNQQVITTTPLQLIGNQQQAYYLLATSATCLAYQNDNRFIPLPADDLVRWVEQTMPHSSQQQQWSYLTHFWQSRLAKLPSGYLILGCTHFLHIASKLQTLGASQHIIPIDTRITVAKAAANQISTVYPHLPTGKVSLQSLYLTRNSPADHKYYKPIAQEYNLEINPNGLL